LQAIPLISITGGRPVMLIPLSIVMGLSMLKDLLEDYSRHKSDRQENEQQTLIMGSSDKSFTPE